MMEEVSDREPVLNGQRDGSEGSNLQVESGREDLGNGSDNHLGRQPSRARGGRRGSGRGEGRSAGTGRTQRTGAGFSGPRVITGTSRPGNGSFDAVPPSPGPGPLFSHSRGWDESHVQTQQEERRRRGHQGPRGRGGASASDSWQGPGQLDMWEPSHTTSIPSPDVSSAGRGRGSRIGNREYQHAPPFQEGWDRGRDSGPAAAQASSGQSSRGAAAGPERGFDGSSGSHSAGIGYGRGREMRGGGRRGSPRGGADWRRQGRGDGRGWQGAEFSGPSGPREEAGDRRVLHAPGQDFAGGAAGHLEAGGQLPGNFRRGGGRPQAAARAGGRGRGPGQPTARSQGGRGILAQGDRSRERGGLGLGPEEGRALAVAKGSGAAQAAGEAGSVPRLVQEIEEKLRQGRVECMICYDAVGRSAPCWSCGSCFAIFHLHCIRKWARAPTSADTSLGPVSHSGDASWRCPGCQTAQRVRPNEIKYRCFCGAREEPPRDDFLIPHSCGEVCGKALDRTGEGACPHHCTLQCHPGPCPPCTAAAPAQKCHCGKEEFVLRCAEQVKGGVSCQQPCGRALLCGRHFCQRPCHAGDCGTCEVLVPTHCYCGKKEEAMRCGHLEPEGANEGGPEGGHGGDFSCSQVCSATLACGKHKCERPCHRGPCGECQLLPSKVATCPCGKRAVTELLPPGEERTSCLDVVPTCGQTCNKVLPCGKHQCSMQCHEGPCQPCQVEVEQPCRCGDTTRLVPCYKTLNPGKTLPQEGVSGSEPSVEGGGYTGPEDGRPFLCEKKCGKKMNCGRHRCTHKCCPVGRDGIGGNVGADDPHLCMLTCGKKLQCGQHSCQELCHAGHCPPCLNSIFTELSCACGATVVPPPAPCGTPLPACPRVCSLPQACGHPATHLCHFGDCPPCTAPVARSCVGGHVVLRGVPCGSRDIKCNNRCGKLRRCKQHFCSRACHLPPCDPPAEEGGDGVGGEGPPLSCGQPCGAQRRDCQHTCTAPCHPGAPCPDLRCQTPVSISCSCGRLTAQVPCGCGGGREPDSRMVLSSLPTPLQPVEDRARVPLGQRKLSCDDECAKLEKRRLLAEAFQPFEGAADPVLAAGADALAEASRKEPQWLAGAEARLQALVLGSGRTGTNKDGIRVHVFRPMPSRKREALHLLAERWALGSASTGREPRRMVAVYTSHKSRPPPKLVGSRGPIPPPGQAAAPGLHAELDLDPKQAVALFDLPREANVSSQLLRFGGECDLVWLNDKNALAIFEDPARAATALRYLDHAAPYWGANARQVVPAGGAGRGSVWGGRGPPPVARLARRAGAAEGWAEDAWGEDEGSGLTSTTGAWHRKGGALLAPTGNLFAALGNSSSAGEGLGSGHGEGAARGAEPGTATGSRFTVLGGRGVGLGADAQANGSSGKGVESLTEESRGDGEVEEWEKILDE